MFIETKLLITFLHYKPAAPTFCVSKCKDLPDKVGKETSKPYT